MFQVIKKSGKTIHAYRLGDNHPVLTELEKKGLLVPLHKGTQFEVMSQEAVTGGSGHGQLAWCGDYIKIDSAGYPYPNDFSYFQKNHRHISGDIYEQIPTPLMAWTTTEPICEEILYLMKHKGLQMNPADPDHYFIAPLWGTVESAPADAIVIFYSVERNGDQIKDISFNFVVREEFERTYSVC